MCMSILTSITSMLILMSTVLLGTYGFQYILYKLSIPTKHTYCKKCNKWFTPYFFIYSYSNNICCHIINILKKEQLEYENDIDCYDFN